ncbi:M23 family metallopeptidase [Pedobacter psychrophilus]|nr:M23 family metallopeptidase [Pedobacter psychrophilus]
MIKLVNYFAALCILIGFFSCKTIFKSSPYQGYINSLVNVGLDTTAMGKIWINNGLEVLSNPNQNLKFPFKEEIFFKQNIPSATAYQINYKQSTKLKFTINSKSKSGVFLDLFNDVSSRKAMISEFISDTTFYYQSDNDEVLTLRLQPKLLVNLYTILEVAELPKLAFPVKNGENKDIKSFWGNSRDGGERNHEGVDIFNKRNTPVLAVADGTISRVQITTLGGKVVWQKLGLGGPSIYYAHLDSQLVNIGQSVNKGDVVGFIGNTGNAKTTSPHLHFGIYTNGGAIDPLNYIYKRDSIVGKVKSDVKYLGEELMLADNDSVIPVNILSVSTESITFGNGDGILKYQNSLKGLNPKINKKTNIVDSLILEAPENTAIPTAKFNKKLAYKVLGYSGDFLYISQEDKKGWIKAI